MLIMVDLQYKLDGFVDAKMMYSELICLIYCFV